MKLTKSNIDLEIEGRNQNGVHRCSICNRVSNEEIETNMGDYVQDLSFTFDPNNSLFDICVECGEAIDEVRHDYDFEEEEEGW